MWHRKYDEVVPIRTLHSILVLTKFPPFSITTDFAKDKLMMLDRYHRRPTASQILSRRLEIRLQTTHMFKIHVSFVFSWHMGVRLIVCAYQSTRPRNFLSSLCNNTDGPSGVHKSEWSLIHCLAETNKNTFRILKLHVLPFFYQISLPLFL